MARDGRAGEARGVPRPDVLGPPDPRLRRPRRARADPRARARRARRQPHGARVHGRSLGRLPLRRPAPHRLRQPAHLGTPRRRPRAARLLHHRQRALRAAGQPAAARGARALLALARARARPDRDAARDRLPRRVRLGGRAAHPGAGRRAAAPAAPPLRARRRVPPPARLLPPEPAEHVHGQADGRDDRRRAGAGARRWPRSRSREALRRGPARPPRGDPGRGDVGRALPDRHQRAGADPLPARADRLLRGGGRRRGRARRRIRGRRARSGPSGRPLRRPQRAGPARLRPRRRARQHRRPDRAGRAHRRAADLLGRGGLRDPADLGGAALDVAGAAARATRAAPRRLRARLRHDRADLHRRPAADGADRDADVPGRRADHLRRERDDRDDRLHRPRRRRARSAPTTRRAPPRAASARSPHPACARSC